MTKQLPDPATLYPVLLPDGTIHKGTVYLKPALRHANIDVGEYTYYSDLDPLDDPSNYAARLAPYLFEGSAERLQIGKFCQIASGAQFLTSGANHATAGATTFPFAIFDPDRIGAYQPDTRDTIIGHDVWIGAGATVLPGAQIGNGVIIGARAVVGGKIPDYAVVVGNRGRILRMRFDPDIIKRLNALAWWDWPAQKIAENMDVLVSDKIDGLIGK